MENIYGVIRTLSRKTLKRKEKNIIIIFIKQFYSYNIILKQHTIISKRQYNFFTLPQANIVCTLFCCPNNIYYKTYNQFHYSTTIKSNIIIIFIKQFYSYNIILKQHTIISKRQYNFFTLPRRASVKSVTNIMKPNRLFYLITNSVQIQYIVLESLLVFIVFEDLSNYYYKIIIQPKPTTNGVSKERPPERDSRPADREPRELKEVREVRDSREEEYERRASPPRERELEREERREQPHDGRHPLLQFAVDHFRQSPE
ncbi:unnamed protein product [Leptidea sinapis]|uniref:Uncharacterized protein n=1 Tax=Leptidea sinapis TaxID=189913 RepID=A0A5E4PNI5_9NEOP|nr:unnamed protein product [Leptidea sinapis]